MSGERETGQTVDQRYKIRKSAMFEKNLKKIMSVVLTAVLIAQMLGVTAFAEEPVSSNDAAIEETGDGYVSPETPDQSDSPQGEALEDGENIDESLPPLGEGAPEGRMREDDETVSEDDATVSEDDATVSADSASVSSDAAPEIEAVEGDAPEVLGATSGTCGINGSNLKWTTSLISGSNNYKLTITGIGAMEDFSSTYVVPWNTDQGHKISQIEIGAGVTSIGKYAFDGSICSNYASVTSLNVSIPEGVTTIGDYAFNGQTKLYNIFFPKSIKKIGECAFKGCKYLDSVCFWGNNTLDDQLSIGKYAFSGCKNTMSITFPKYFDIGADAFTGVNSLRIYSPYSKHYFYFGQREVSGYDQFKEIIMDPGGATGINYVYTNSAYGYIGDGNSGSSGVNYKISDLNSASPTLMIYGNGKMLNLSSSTKYPWSIYNYKDLTINKDGGTNDVTGIGQFAFANNSGLDSVKFDGDKRISIGKEAFYNCKSASFSSSAPGKVFLDHIGVIGPHAFFHCESMSGTIKLTSSHTLEETADGKGNNFSSCTSITGLTIDMGNKSIPKQAFYGCTGLVGSGTLRREALSQSIQIHPQPIGFLATIRPCPYQSIQDLKLMSALCRLMLLSDSCGY